LSLLLIGLVLLWVVVNIVLGLMVLVSAARRKEAQSESGSLSVDELLSHFR
jgi:hypothetical protein